MLIIGEKINSTRKSIDRAVRQRDTEVIITEAKRQVEAGAHFLDVNCGSLEAEDEPAAMEWLVSTVQSATGLPLCIDSPNYEAQKAGLSVHQGEPMINSISAESERFEKILPLVKKYNAKVIGLCLDDRGIPSNKETAIEVGDKLVSALMEAGIPIDNIYLDPLVRTLATDQTAVLDTIFLMQTLRDKYDGLHFVSGLSNVSYGLPDRRHLNRAYVVMSIAAGLDAVIMNPLDKGMHPLIFAAEALVNKDRFCLSYIKAHDNGILSD